MTSLFNHHLIRKQTLTLQPIEGPGRILDLGGGGEGVIGQLCGERVLAIDRRRDELVESHGCAVKMVMNARELSFGDESFSTATAFFFFMFTRPEERSAIFKEAFRILRPSGRLLIWDITIPPYAGKKDKVFCFPLAVKFPDGRKINTGYGCRWSRHQQTQADYLALAQEAGFKVQSYEPAKKGDWFQIELRK
jgi:ubiquinone/menaquinone biosynthesis C-methylase UbiE